MGHCSRCSSSALSPDMPTGRLIIIFTILDTNDDDNDVDEGSGIDVDRIVSHRASRFLRLFAQQRPPRGALNVSQW